MINQLVKETIGSLVEFLPKVIKETRSTAELFHTDREAMALRNMVPIIEAYTWVLDALNGIKSNGFLQDVNLEDMKNFLSEIEQAMMFQDYIAISDILEYEVVEILDGWQSYIHKEIEENQLEMD